MRLLACSEQGHIEGRKYQFVIGVIDAEVRKKKRLVVVVGIVF